MVPGQSAVTGAVEHHELCTLVQIERWVTVAFCKTHERWVILQADDCPQDLYDAAVTVIPEGTELVDWGEMDRRDYLAFAEVRSSERESASVHHMS